MVEQTVPRVILYENTSDTSEAESHRILRRNGHLCELLNIDVFEIDKDDRSEILTWVGRMAIQRAGLIVYNSVICEFETGRKEALQPYEAPI